MARTPSTMVALGSNAADFRLLNPANNQQVARDDLHVQPLPLRQTYP